MIFNVDKELFGSDPDCVKYISTKVFQELGKITDDNLDKLANLRFSITDMNIYLTADKYNL